MFLPKPQTAIDEIIRDYGLDSIDREIITGYLQLSESDREEVRKYLQSIVETKKRESLASRAALEREADEFAAMAREQFLEEKRRELQASSAGGSDEDGGDRLA